MTLLLPGNPVEDPNIQQKFDAISLAWQDNRSVVATLAAAATADVTIQSTDALAIIDFDLETSALCELRMFPNAGAAPFNTAIYINVRDGSAATAAPAFVAIAAAGNAVADNNGARLGYAPLASAAGGQHMTGHCIFGTQAPAGNVRTAITQTACASPGGSGNQQIELQNIAGRIASGVAITSLRFAVSAGTMTGRIRVTRG